MNANQPLIAIDVVPVSFSTVDGLRFGVAQRRFAPFEGENALPGVLLGAGELLEDAAYRALSDKAGISRDQVQHLSQLGAFDGPGRDPRDHAISVAFLAITDTHVGGETTRWEVEPSNLPFDHDSIVAAAREALRVRLWSDTAVTRSLTGRAFTTPDAATLEGQITGTKPRLSNLLRKLTIDPRVEREATGAAFGHGKPAAVWRWLR